MNEWKLEDLRVSKLNPRKHIDEGKLAELVESIKEKGVIQPILVRRIKGKPGAEIVCGERRYRAADKAGLQTIPAVLRELTDEQAMEIMVIENLQREDVHPLEEAEGYEALLKKKKGLRVEDIAAKVGKTKAYVYGRLKLCELIPANRKLFYAGKFAPSVALLLARVPKDLQLEAGKRIAQGKTETWVRAGEPMSYAQAKKYIEERLMVRLKGAQFSTREKGLAGKTSCAECPKRTGNQQELFADVAGKDICTDPQCFEEKKNAFAQRKVDELKKAGKTVMPPAEAKKLFSYQGADAADGYINVEEADYRTDGEKLRPLIKAGKAGDVKTVHAVHPFTGKVVEMVKSSDASKILKAAGIKSSRSSSGGKDIVAAKKENRVTAARRGFWLEKARIGITEHDALVLTLTCMLDDMGYVTAEEFLEEQLPEAAGFDENYQVPYLYGLSDDLLKKLLLVAYMRKIELLADEELECLSSAHGFDIAKDYVITEEYLQAMTKSDLVALAKETGISSIPEIGVLISTGSTKRAELLRAFLKTAPEKGFDFKGKVPKELCDSGKRGKR